MLRREDYRFLTGSGQYIADIDRPNQCHAYIVRSPIAHGMVSEIDISEATDQAGVLGVFTSWDLTSAGVGPIPLRTSLEGTEIIEPRRPLLADGEVKFAGQPVALVVAESQAAAQSAAELVQIDFEELPAVAHMKGAGEDGAPQIWPEAPGNRSFIWDAGDRDSIDRAIAGADHVLDLTIDHPRVIIAPVETRGAIGEYDPESGRYTLHTPSQGVMMLRAAMADILGVEERDMRVVTPDVGGSFAVKIFPYPEQALCLFAAKALGRPVKWISEKTEGFLSDNQGRARIDYATLALTKAGKITAFKIDATTDVGAFHSAAGPTIQTRNAVRTMGHTYDIGAQYYRAAGYFTNAAPVDAYRGAGKPETVATLERLIDAAAAKFGFDPIELRRANLIQPHQIPFTTRMGEVIDAGDYPDLLNAILSQSDYDGFAERRTVSEARGLRRGFGIGLYIHTTGGGTTETSTVRAEADGRITVLTGTQDSGQGHQTSLAQIAGDALGIPSDRIDVFQGDSDRINRGGGTGGSNLLAIAGVTVHRAALQMIERTKLVAAQLMEAAPVDIEYEAGEFRIVGTDKHMSLADVSAGFAGLPADAVTSELQQGCTGELDFEGQNFTYPCGAYTAEVEIDPETGHIDVVRFAGVDDLGRIVNEGSARGQIQGGIAQAVGEALMEEAVYEPGTAQLLSGSTMDYRLPRADDLPNFDLKWAAQPTDSPNNPLGVKGAGEVSSIGAVAPVMNAVMNALSGDGVAHLDIPITPEKVWRALQNSNSS